jgi:hypothetical protein
MEAPMKRRYFIGLDTHGQFCEMAVVDAKGDVVRRGHCATNIPTLVQLVEQVPRPRRLVIEEGPMADWLWRNLRAHAEEMVVCEPRRNRLIAADGEKDDPIDAGKLASCIAAATSSPCTTRSLWSRRFSRRSACAALQPAGEHINSSFREGSGDSLYIK